MSKIGDQGKVVIDLPPFVGVVTFNPIATMRFDLLERTVRSIEEAFPTSELFLLDNLSSDGSQSAVAELLGEPGVKCSECGGVPMRGRWHLPWMESALSEPNRTPGAGRDRLYYSMFNHIEAGRHECPFWVWSDDDMVWREGAEATLRHFWSEAPDDIAIVSGLLEPVWSWNTPRETVDAGGVRVLVRDSAPGAGWTFRERHFIPVPSNEDYHRFGYDYESCKRIVEAGFRVAQIDLAEHIGWGFSTHGNEANEAPETKPLDRDKWGV